MPLSDALSAIYVIADEWMWRRSVLAAMGVKDPDPWEAVLGQVDGGA